MVTGKGSRRDLLEAAADPDSTIRWFALEALISSGASDEEGLVETAETCLGDEDPYVAEAAFELLSRCGTSGVERLLRLVQNHPSALWALVWWGKVEGAAAIDLLVSNLSHEDEEVRSATETVLGRLVDTAGPALALLIDSGHEDETSMRALAALLQVQQGARPFLHTRTRLVLAAIEALDRSAAKLRILETRDHRDPCCDGGSLR